MLDSNYIQLFCFLFYWFLLPRCIYWLEINFNNFQQRQKSSQVTTLAAELEEKNSQCTHQASRIKELENEIAAQEEEAQALHKEIREKGSMIAHTKEEGERIQQIHQEQCKDYQKQIDIVS